MPSVVYNAKSAVGGGGPHLCPAAIGAAVKMFKYQHIAPAPVAAAAAAGDDIKSPKYLPRATLAAASPFGVEQTHSVQRRNARERNRVKQVNNSFANLRQHIPQTIIADLTKGGGRGPHKKISKVDTLRIAVEYIRRLQDLVDDLNSNCDSGSDSASNGSFCSSSSHAASSPSPSQSAPAAPAETATSAQLYFMHAASPPLPAFQFAQLHQQQQTPQQQQPPQHQAFPSALLTPVSLNSFSPPPAQSQLEAATAGGCHSPTSSFNSSMSFDSGNFEAAPQTHLQLKYEPYDGFKLHEEDRTPDDEEILDYISLWQEQ